MNARDSGPTDDGGGSGTGPAAGSSGRTGRTDGGGPRTSPDGGPNPTPALPGATALRIEPATLALTEDGAEPFEMADFRAIGTFENGDERDVTANVSWSIDDSDLGELNGAAFTSKGIGGRTTVRARAATLEAEADVEVTLEVRTKIDGAPDGIEDLFAADPAGDMVVEDDSLRIVYPSHETMFPRNLERVDHQWRADAALNRFEVRFESDIALVRFYTSEPHLLPDLAGWRWLANTHAGRSLQMTVRGVSSEAPEVIVRSQPITLYYSRSEVPGALYYWSTGAEGVMKGTISAAMAVKFYTDPQGDDATCVACHTVSRNGRKLSAGYGGEKLRVISVPDRGLLIPSDPMAKAREYGWGTFSPDANRLLYASKGVLTMLDANDGAELFGVTLPMGFKATHPDWAPNGQHVAIAYSGATARIDNKNAQGTSLARLAVAADGTLEAPEILIASTDGTEDSLFFPSYAPDSAWIAFVRAVGKSKDNVTSTLFIAPADGGDPIALTRLNERVRHEDGVTGIGNSMPTWAPSTKPDIFWIAFSSLRAYGDVLESGRDQLWAAAIDPEKLGTGEDPSYAAFWLPFQDVNEGNHRAFWAIDTAVDCPDKIEICDNLDNDCDGVVDEECCTPEEESCGDGEDNDCDGMADEGCCEASPEVCDGVDNDCDLVSDEGCCVPSPEVCDGVDNDCDLVKDEGCGCLLKEMCSNEKDDDCDQLIDENCVD